MWRVTGFQLINDFRIYKNAGYKLGAWRGILWMVKEIVGSDEEPAKPLELSRIVR